ncbi:hypothetical protein D918_02016 [Trichuris suis]|nr:hypothetical protein D918_02016 [Trichuris suis]
MFLADLSLNKGKVILIRFLEKPLAKLTFESAGCYDDVRWLKFHWPMAFCWRLRENFRTPARRRINTLLLSALNLVQLLISVRANKADMYFPAVNVSYAGKPVDWNGLVP